MVRCQVVTAKFGTSFGAILVDNSSKLQMTLFLVPANSTKPSIRQKKTFYYVSVAPLMMTLKPCQTVEHEIDTVSETRFCHLGRRL